LSSSPLNVVSPGAARPVGQFRLDPFTPKFKLREPGTADNMDKGLGTAPVYSPSVPPFA
jgi:hypothetical protein